MSFPVTVTSTFSRDDWPRRSPAPGHPQFAIVDSDQKCSSLVPRINGRECEFDCLRALLSLRQGIHAQRLAISGAESLVS